MSTWVELEPRLSRVAPALAAGLCEGASPDELERIEGLLEQPLPGEVRALWSVHDGQDDEWPLLDGAMLLPLDRAVAMRAALMAEPALDWPGDWLPLATNGRGALLLVDLAVGALEQYGKVREKGSPGRGEGLRSFAGLFQLLCSDLDRERKVWDDLYGLVGWGEVEYLRKERSSRDFEGIVARLEAQARRRTERALQDMVKRLDRIGREAELAPTFLLHRGLAHAGLGQAGPAIVDLEAWLDRMTTRLTVSGFEGRTVERVTLPPEAPGLRALLALLRRAPALAAMPAPRGAA